MTVNRKKINFKLNTAKNASGSLHNLRESVRSGYGVNERPTPFPFHTDLRSWDQTVLLQNDSRYFSFCDRYCLNTNGKCEHSGGGQDACGIKPETLVALEIGIDNCKKQVTSFISAIDSGQERITINLNLKVFHAGMIDYIVPGTADIIYLSAFDFPKVDTVISPVEPGLRRADAPKKN